MGNRASTFQSDARSLRGSDINHCVQRYRTGWRLKFLALAVGMIVVPNSFAQSIADETGTSVTRLTQGLLERVSFDIDRFQIIGENPLSEQETRSLVAPYIGQSRGIDDIEDAADAVEKAITDKGLSFYKVSFPPQELSDGVIDLQIKRYQIGKISVQGNNYYTDRNIIASLPKLKPGKSPSTTQIARSLRIANQNAGKRVRVTLAPGEAANEIDAQVAVVDQKPLNFGAWLNNTGTDASGDYRVGASVSHRNLFGRDHSGAITFITSPEGIDDVQQFAVNYGVPLYSLGGSLSFIGVKSDIDTGTVGGVFDVAGRGEVISLGYTQTLTNFGNYNHSLSLQASDKLFDNNVRFQGTQLLEDVRSRPLALSYQGSWSNQNGLDFGGAVVITNNLSGGSFNTASSYLASRVGATDVWNKVEVAANFQRSVKEWLYTAVFKYAATSDRLITGEQFAVGGTNSVRGMEERELRGDEGYQLNFQAWAPSLTPTLRPIAFVDAGRVENNSPVEGEFDSETVLSIGVLLNWNPTSKITASASYGYLIDGVDTESVTNASQDGDSKLHFNFSYRF